MKPSNIFLSLFFLIVGVNLFAEYNYWQMGIYLSKPLLITTLAIYFYLETKNHSTAFSKFILVGLVFSIGGDTLLMFVEGNPDKAYFFLLGLSSFLITHIFYYLAFQKYPKFKEGILFSKYWLVAIFLTFLYLNTSYLLDGIPGGLKFPVLAYSTVIILMIMGCLNMWGRVDQKAFILLFSGAVLFMISDNLIALNKFKADELTIPLARILIMTTYLAGQFLIVKGSILCNRQLR